MKPANNAMQWLYDHWMKATPVSCLLLIHSDLALRQGAELRALPHLDADADLLAARVRGVYMSRRLSRLFQPQTTWVGAGRLSADEGWFFLDKYSAGLYSFAALWCRFSLLRHRMGTLDGLFFSLECLAHVVMFLSSNGIQSGLLVSALVNIPFGIYTVWYFLANDLVSTGVNVASALFGIVAQASMMIYGFAYLVPKIKRERLKM